MKTTIRIVAVAGLAFLARVLVAIVLSTSIPGVAALAADCGPLKRVASIDLIRAPNGVLIVPVTLNGAPKKLLLGTAGGISTPSKDAVADLGLHAISTARGARLLYRSGEAADTFVSINSFELGGVHGKNVNFMVSPNQRMGSTALPIDGELAGDVLESFDVDMDFLQNQLNLFSTDHCDGKVIYWPTDAIAIVPYRSTKPGTNVPDSHLRVQVKLDGKELNAVINTGSPRSTLSAGTAKYLFHVTAESSGAIPLGTVENDPDHKVFGYVFGNLSFEGVNVNNPRIAVFPDLVGTKDPYNRLRTGSLVRRVDDNNLRPEITIGMDVLKNLHLYVASREHKLYITSATSTPTGFSSYDGHWTAEIPEQGSCPAAHWQFDVKGNDINGTAINSSGTYNLSGKINNSGKGTLKINQVDGTIQFSGDDFESDYFNTCGARHASGSRSRSGT